MAKRGRKLPAIELVAALRDCAAAGLSYQSAAAKLTIHGFPLTRAAVAGLAFRAKPRIKFGPNKPGTVPWGPP